MSKQRSFGDFQAAMAMRDIIGKFTTEVVDRMRPPSFTAQVVQIDHGGRVVYVRTVGSTEEDTPLRIKYSQDRQPAEVGGIVEVSGSPGNYWVSRILAGNWQQSGLVQPGDIDWLYFGEDIPLLNGVVPRHVGSFGVPRICRKNGIVYTQGQFDAREVTSSIVVPFYLPDELLPDNLVYNRLYASHLSSTTRNTGYTDAHIHTYAIEPTVQMFVYGIQFEGLVYFSSAHNKTDIDFWTSWIGSPMD